MWVFFFSLSKLCIGEGVHVQARLGKTHNGRVIYMYMYDVTFLFAGSR